MSAGVSMAPRFATVLNDGSLMSRAIGLCSFRVARNNDVNPAKFPSPHSQTPTQ